MKHIHLTALLLALLLIGCSDETPSIADPADALPAETTFFAMDTLMSLTVYGEEHLLSEAQARVSELEAMLSVTDTSSEIYHLNHNGSALLSTDPTAILTQALALCRRTQGALDLSIYPVVRAWGFTTGEYAVPSSEDIQALLAHVDYEKITLDPETGEAALEPGMEIDLGSVAKGYTSDQLIQLLKRSGVTSALVNLGGNVQTLGSKPDGSPWRIAVQDPSGNGYLGVLEVTDQAVITSGGYERYFEQDGVTYWHIIDPSTGSPAHSGLTSVTIVGDCGLLCDGLSTSLFIMGRDAAIELWRSSQDFEMILVQEDGQITLTEGLEGRFSSDQYTFDVVRRSSI